MCDRHEKAIGRRALMTGGLAGVGLAGLPALRRAWAAPAERPKPRMSAEEALRSLQEGNARYAENRRDQNDFSANRMALVKSQRPIAAVLGCGDSRVSPELLFDQDPGDLFVTRVAGNFLNTDGLASTEYAVEFLGTQLIFVLGHTGCGAVGAAIKVLDEDIDLPGQLPDLVQPIFRAVQDARRRNSDNLLEAAIETNVRHQVARFKSMSSVVGKYVATGELQVVGGVYNIATGRVRMVT